MALETFDAWLCTDCAMLIANGADGWGTDDKGQELGELHAARFVAHRSSLTGLTGHLVNSECSEDGCEFARPTICGACDPSDLGTANPDDCDHGEPDNDHECRFDLHFSTAECDGCGTTLAGHRHAGAELVDRA